MPGAIVALSCARAIRAVGPSLLRTDGARYTAVARLARRLRRRRGRLRPARLEGFLMAAVRFPDSCPSSLQSKSSSFSQSSGSQIVTRIAFLKRAASYTVYPPHHPARRSISAAKTPGRSRIGDCRRTRERSSRRRQYAARSPRPARDRFLRPSRSGTRPPTVRRHRQSWRLDIERARVERIGSSLP